MNAEQLVQIVGPTDNWILERLARRLAAKLPYARFVPHQPEPDADTALVYYVNYALFSKPSGHLDVGFFTHCEDTQRFLDLACGLSFCVCMSRKYAEWLLQQGVPTVAHIPMGFDAYRFRPRLVLGVVGLLEHPRKGGHLVEELRKLPFVEVIVTEGKVPEDQLPEFYQRLDYVLIPATVEGGPLSLLEGLAMGKPILAPADVGLVGEFWDVDQIRLYPAGDQDALVRLVTACYEEKAQRGRVVQERTWDRWAQAHHHLFSQLVESKGLPPPKPALGFRFGMLGELNVPPGLDVAPLEAAVDEAARHLFFRRYGPARAVLGDVVPRFPFAGRLLETLPLENGEFPRQRVPRPPAPGVPAARPVAGKALGCVLAIQNRPAAALERTLQTYRFQTYPPVDKVLLDYGSEPALAAAYRDLCLRYGWRYQPLAPAKPGWSLSAAYNAAVSALSERVEVVFKSDTDILLGEDVLARAAQLGGDQLCIFECLTTQEGTRYPPRIAGQRDLLDLLHGPRQPEPMWGEGVHAFPRHWFQDIGGLDLAYGSWGYEDSDLRLRADWSIGFVNVKDAVLIHQWHPRSGCRDEGGTNRAYYEQTKRARQVGRNGKQAAGSSPVPVSPRAEPAPAVGRRLRVVFATRSLHEELYRLSGELLGLEQLGQRYAVDCRRQRFVGTDALGYFRELAGLDADWVVSLDEDAFVLEPDRIGGLLKHLEEHGFAACGMPDGGVVTIRQHNPVACNAFFNVFDLRRARPAWQDWGQVAAAQCRAEYEKLVPPFARRTALAFDRFEPYYGVFFSLLAAGERVLYLDAEDWRDGVSTLLKDAAGAPFLLHCWYARNWGASDETRRRYQAALEYARQQQMKAAASPRR